MQEQEVIIHHQPVEFVNQKPEPRARDIEFLEKYEIKNWEFSPRLYKILAASAVFNILALFVFAQTNVLQARACDSPWVNRVCQVLDTVYLGSTILSTDSEFVSKPYEKTELEDAEIVWINQTGTEPLNYPGGYFALANPESQFTAMQDPTLMNPDMSGFQDFTPPSTNFPTQTPMTVTPSPNFPNLPPQKLPPVAKNQVIIPDNIIGENPIGKNPGKGKTPKTDVKKPDNNETAKTDEKEPETKQPGIESLPVADEIINKKPLQDFGDTVLDKVAKKEVDLTKAFSVVMVGTINKDGKFDATKSAYVKEGGDQAMIDVAKSAIEAIGDSGILTYLKRLDVNQIKFELVQDDKQIYAVITSNQPTVKKAETVSSGLNTAISIGKMTVKEEDTLALLNAAKVESKDKNFILNFNMEKAIAQELIKRQLEKAEAKKKEAEQKPNSTAQTENANKTTGK